MKKNVSIALTIASLIIILDAFNAGAALVAFILTGIIPGTNIAVSATGMLIVYGLIAGFIFARITRRTSLQNARS